MAKPEKYLVTCALPYANGALHLGHMLEYIQADIWVRWQRLQGHDVLFISGEDAHGTPIMLNAQKQGITPEALIAKAQQDHTDNIQKFSISLNHFYTTHSPENQTLANFIYTQLNKRGDITRKTIEQAFDAQKNVFLPDRFIKGDCPKCGAPDQYGDNCEVCGSTYSPTDLKNAKSVLSGSTPIQKMSEHLFFELSHYQDFLTAWITSDAHLQSEVANKLLEWFKNDLKAWDISRDAPYFGFEIPGEPGKYFYVWLDAPIGYMATLKNFCAQHPEVNFEDYWKKNSTAQLIHFIGKDIVYFHALFWPAMLTGSDFRTPSHIYVHGYVTVNGEKMSKSRGTFITAEKYLTHLNPEYLRYYYAAKLTAGVEDLDLNLTDFMQRVNSDVVGKVVNIASRCAGFITKKFAGQLAEHLERPALYHELLNAQPKINELFQERQFHLAVREIMQLADKVNQYIDERKPWVLAKEDATLPEVQLICTQGLNCFRVLMSYLQAILPTMAQASADFLRVPDLSLHALHTPLLKHSIHTFVPLMQRVELSAIQALTT